MTPPPDEAGAPRPSEPAEGERFLSTILDTIASLVLVLDREGRIAYFNRACERVTGYTFEEVRGRHPWDMLLLPEDVAAVQGVFGKLRAGQSNSYDNVWVTKDGRRREIAWTNTILGDAEGNVQWVVPTGIDVTERRASERRLAESERRYGLLFDSAADAAFVCDAAPESGFRILEANAQASRRLGHAPAALVGTRMLDLHPPSEWEVCQRAVARLRSEGEILFETTERRADGSVLPVEVSAHLFELDGHPAMLTISRDLSERRRMEEQLAQANKLEAIGRLAGGVAHDFNNLLVVILSEADLLRESLAESDELRASADEILRAGRKAAALTQQLLAFGRRRVVRPASLDLNAVIAEMGKMLERLVGEDVRLSTRLAPVLPPIVADPAGVQQILVNLIVNARDAMPRGGTVTISTERIEVTGAAAAAAGVPAGRYVQLAVRDDGVGMTDEVRQRVFEPFFTTKAEGRGTGLGLATVFGTVKQAGGHVVVESSAGAGACFRVLLPQATQAAEAEPPKPPRARPRGEGRTVLVVEDDPAVLGIANRILDDQGYRVLTANDPRAALGLCATATHPIDVVLTDVIMPHLNGRELADRVRATHPRAALVYMSGYTNDIIARSGALDAGLLFVEKPFSREELLDKVAEALDARPQPAPPTLPFGG